MSMNVVVLLRAGDDLERFSEFFHGYVLLGHGRISGRAINYQVRLEPFLDPPAYADLSYPTISGHSQMFWRIGSC